MWYPINGWVLTAQRGWVHDCDACYEWDQFQLSLGEETNNVKTTRKIIMTLSLGYERERER